MNIETAGRSGAGTDGHLPGTAARSSQTEYATHLLIKIDKLGTITMPAAAATLRGV